MNRIDLTERNVVITGGAQGIGYAIGQRVVASGGRVAIWDLNLDKASEAAKALGGGSVAFGVDVSASASVAAAATAASTALPPALRISIAAWLASCEMVATAPPWPVSTACFAQAPKAAIIRAVARSLRVFMVCSVMLGG